MKNTILLILAFLFFFNLSSNSQGASYTGSYTISAPIVWKGISNSTISGLEIKNPNGPSIQLINCSNITIENCRLGPSKGQGVDIYNCTNITTKNCTIEDVSTGLRAGTSSGIKFIYNDVKNVKGPYPAGQMVQFDDVTGGGNSISYNVDENILGQSLPEDQINIYKSSGTATDPLLVSGNWIRGGGPSSSGGGIVAGDMGGSYTLISDNILVNPGQYGIAIASGKYNTIKNNKIFSETLPFSNVGLFAWNQYPTECSSITIMNNELNFKRSTGEVKNTWNPGNCGTITGWDTNFYNPNLDASILPAKIIGRVVGVTTEVKTEVLESQDIKIYPNPVIDFFTIESKSELTNGIATIYNLNGQKLIEQPLNINKTEINTTTLIKGVYIVKVTSANKNVDKMKLIVEGF